MNPDEFWPTNMAAENRARAARFLDGIMPSPGERLLDALRKNATPYQDQVTVDATACDDLRVEVIETRGSVSFVTMDQEVDSASELEVDVESLSLTLDRLRLMRSDGSLVFSVLLAKGLDWPRARATLKNGVVDVSVPKCIEDESKGVHVLTGTRPRRPSAGGLA